MGFGFGGLCDSRSFLERSGAEQSVWAKVRTGTGLRFICSFFHRLISSTVRPPLCGGIYLTVPLPKTVGNVAPPRRSRTRQTALHVYLPAAKEDKNI